MTGLRAAGIAASAPMATSSDRMGTLAASILATSVVIIDGSVVNVALPAMQEFSGLQDAALPWVVMAYLLPLGALMLLGGGAGDRLGRRRVLQVGLVLFSGASLLSAAAPEFRWLLAFRALQGMGAALVLPNSAAILAASFGGEAKGNAVGTWAAACALAGATGPLIGGLMIDALGWRAIFLLTPPLAGTAAYLVRRHVHDGGDMDLRRLDWEGSAAATLGMLAITWALSSSRDAEHEDLLWLACLGGAALLGVFVWIERIRGQDALMPLALFATRSYIGLSVLTFLLYAGFSGLLVLLPLVLNRVAHFSATAAGAAMLPLPIAIGLGSRLMGRLAVRRGGRRPLTVGSIMVAFGLLLFGRIDESIRYWPDIFPPTLLVAIGMGMIAAPLTTSVMTSVDDQHAGVASAFNSALARIGGLVAVALTGRFWTLQASSAALVASVQDAALVGAALAFASATSALILVRGRKSAGEMTWDSSSSSEAISHHVRGPGCYA